MILTNKKLQEGGSLFKPSQIKSGAANFHALLNQFNTASGRGGYGGSSGYGSRKSSSKKSNQPDIDDMLPSDLAYYDAALDAIDTKLKEGMENDPEGFDQSLGYESLMKKRYNLTSSYLAGAKSKYDIYKKGLTQVQKGAGDAPAVYEGNVMVLNKGDEETSSFYDVVTPVEVLKNSDQYRIVPLSEAVSMRGSASPEFASGTKLGTLTDKLMVGAFGFSDFEKAMQNRIKQAGYSKTKGMLMDGDGNLIDITNLGFSPAQKTNKAQINSIINTALDNQSVLESNFLQGMALKKAHSDSRQNEEMKNMSDSELHTYLEGTMGKYVFNQFKHTIKDELEFKDEDTESDTDPHKTIKKGTLAVALENMNVEKATVMTNVGDNKMTVSKLPAAPLLKGRQVLNQSFRDIPENQREDKDVSAQHVYNNNLLMDLGDVSTLTTADGEVLSDLVKMEETTVGLSANDTYVTVAPVVERDGKYYVDYNIPGLDKLSADMKSLIGEIDKAKSEGKTPEDILNILYEAESKFEDATNIKFKIALSFPVTVGESKEIKDHPLFKRNKMYDAALEGRTGNDEAYESRAFMVLKGSTLRSAIYSDLLQPGTELTTTVGSHAKSLGVNNEVGDGMSVIASQANEAIKNRADGGKLPSVDEVSKLLFD